MKIPGRKMRPLLFTMVLMGACTAGERAGLYAGAGVSLAHPIAKVAFTLTDTDGKPYDFVRETAGRLTLLFFGYTHCPDVCPVHMANLAAALDRVPLDVSSEVTVVFVTTDPERDTPERLRDWLDQFDPQFVGLWGPPDELERIQRELQLAPAVREGEGDDDYLVSHAAAIMAFTPDDSARVVFPFGTRQADWVRELPQLVTSGR